MNPMNIAKVNALPTVFKPNTMYMVKSATAGVMDFYLSDSAGSGVRKVGAASDALTKVITLASAAPTLPNVSPFWQNTTTDQLFYQKSVGGVVSWANVVEIEKASILVTQATAPILPTDTPFWVDSGTGVIYYQKDMSGTTTWQPLSRFDYYSLRIDSTTGTLNANQTQVIKVDNSTAATKTINITNAPTGRAAAFIVKVTGNAGTLSFSNTIGWDAGAVPVLGSVFTVISLFWDGAAFTGCASQRA